MAKRPVFIALSKYPYYEIQDIEFEYFSGFSVSQKQKSIVALHEMFMKLNAGKRVLEVSTKSTELIGTKLSAFNLMLEFDGKKISVENAFQGSKVFEKGGPYIDIYKMSPWEAKKDSRLKESGDIISFKLGNKQFGNEPKDFFYNWIYIKALYENDDYLKAVKRYDAFTDIEFNPQKSINCQAKANAIAVGLIKAGIFDDCVQDKDIFLETVYDENNACYEQMSLFDMN